MLKQQKSRLYLHLSLILIISVVLGRIISHFNSITATDIAYADWVPSLLDWASEIVSSLRTTVSFSAIAAAAYYFGRSTAISCTVISAIAALVDYAARFIIDLFSSALLGMEAFAAIWLLLQFLYEAIFIILALLIACMMKKKADLTETARAREKFSSFNATRASLVLVLLSRIALEVFYLVDFLTSYTNITNAEIASMIGQFIKIIVIYGGIPLLATELFHPLFSKKSE